MADFADIQRATQVIAERSQPERIILFGSHARGEAGPDSDVDLLVVMETDARPSRRALPIRRALWGFALPKDIIVKTPQEFEAGRNQFWTVTCPAAREGKVLYERER